MIWVVKKLVRNATGIFLVSIFMLVLGSTGWAAWGPYGLLLGAVVPLFAFWIYLFADPPEGCGWAIRIHEWAADTDEKSN